MGFFYFAGEGSSGSEEDNSEDDSDSRDQTINRCQHCFSTSKIQDFFFIWYHKCCNTAKCIDMIYTLLEMGRELVVVVCLLYFRNKTKIAKFCRFYATAQPPHV